MDILGVFSIPSWLLCLGLILLSLYLYTTWCQSLWAKLGVPGPKPVPFLGIVNRYFTQNMNDVDMDLHKKYGRIVGTYEGNIPLLLITDPDLIKQIMVKEFSNFTNRFELFYIGEVLSSGVNMARDEHWKFLRNTLSPTFSTGKLKNMLPLIQNNVNTMLDIMSEKSQKGESLEVKSLFGGYTMDVIASTAFGLEINSLKNPDDPFAKHAKMFFSGSFTNPIFLLVLIFPVVTRIFRYFKFSFLIKKWISFFDDVINKAVEMREKDTNTYKDFLQLMLNANKERIDSDGQQIRGLTKNEILGNAMIFMVAGYDTTANTLTFASYCLATNPDIQDKLIEEIDKEIADQTLSYENVMNLEYLDMVLSEVLRLWAPTIRFNRVSAKDINLNGVQIPEGVAVSVPQWVLHRDPEFWPNPEKFDPERFTKENKEQQNPYVYLPFGAGPRNCIGMRLALFEAKLAIVATLQKFKFVTTSETEVPPKLTKGFFIKPEKGMMLKLEAR